MAARTSADESPSDLAERIGLCSRCEHAQVQRSAKGSEFWRCRAADTHAGMLRYPPIPVRVCPAFAATSAADGSELPSRRDRPHAGSEDE